MEKIKRALNWKKIGIVVGIFLLIFVLKTISSSKTVELEVEEKKPLKQIETLLYGKFLGTETREVLATVESPANNTLSARVNGTIQSVYVNIGQNVAKGTVLAEYKKNNDLSQIQYENAQNSFLATQTSAKNSIENSKRVLENAKSEREQIKISETQTRNQLFQNLNTKTTTAMSVFESIKDYLGKIIGANLKHKIGNSKKIISIGGNNSIKKQKTKVAAQNLIREYDIWKNKIIEETIVFSDKEAESIKKSEEVLAFLLKAQIIVNDIGNLIRNTVSSGSFLKTEKQTLEAESEKYLIKINTETLGLDSQLESVKSQNERTNLSLLSAENKVKSAESQLELAESNASSQVSAAQNQVRITQKSHRELTVAAPISGVITEVFVNENDDTNIGTPLFTIISNDTTPEIVTYLTQEEYTDIQTSKTTKIILSTQEELVVETNVASSKLDPKTQKMEVRFLPTKEELVEKNITIGSFAKIHLPFPKKTTFIPLSAISFEPDGAEIFIVNFENKVERKKVFPGKIVGNTIEISGIEEGTKIVRYRLRVNAGEEVLSPNTN